MRLIDADALIDEAMERYCKDCNKRKGVKNVGETDENGVGQALMPNYCPHCGAKMGEAKDNE